MNVARVVCAQSAVVVVVVVVVVVKCNEVQWSLVRCNAISVVQWQLEL